MSIEYREVPSSGDSSFQFHTGETYFDSLSTDIDRQKRGSSVSLSTMGFDSKDPNVLKVVDSMKQAALRGIKSSLAVDNFSLLDRTKVGILGNNFWSTDRYLDGLGAFGIYAGYSNYPTIAGMHHVFPSGVYSGRSHIKSATVGDKVYVGGISLDATDRLDAMVSFTNPDLAARIKHISQMSTISSVRRTLRGNDQVISFDKRADSHLLIDAGVKGQSVIFDEALSIVDSAERELVYASEQFPNGKIGAHLFAAFERGVDVKIAVNHPNSHDRYRLAHRAILELAKKKYPSDFFKYQLSEDAPTLHTKAIASESRAMVGSHNLNTIGVRLGTAEMNVLSSDPEFVKGTSDLVMDQIHQNVTAK